MGMETEANMAYGPGALELAAEANVDMDTRAALPAPQAPTAPRHPAVSSSRCPTYLVSRRPSDLS